MQLLVGAFQRVVTPAPAPAWAAALAPARAAALALETALVLVQDVGVFGETVQEVRPAYFVPGLGLGPAAAPVEIWAQLLP